ncbi:DNA/RNA-binding protein KIN17-like [Crassostrea angulata]|uniref:DNA/RNA-binding protein KIN17-like n=1 Tax=Magallana angulata TaxID=2784310 RepID=UPI0022B1CF09|nr:DNA/RNA-binding protein KIN17-like [Crassostrea angulata]
MGKEKGGFLTPKAIANRIKAKGLQKLRWYCQMCQKQCRDENGFKCHMMSESHQRQLLLFAENPDKYIDDFSKEFMDGYLELLKRRFGTKRVNCNIVYQEYIAYREHIHMNSTQWETLTEFIKWLGREGKCVVDYTEKGWFVQYIDRDPETIKKQEQTKAKEKMDMDDEERTASLIQKQIKRAAEQGTVAKDVEYTELKRESEEEKVSLNFSGLVSKKKDEQPLKSSENPLAVKKPTEAEKTKKKASRWEKEEPKKEVKKDPFKPPKPGEKRKSALDEIMEFEEKKKEKTNRKDYWLTEGIVVKIVTKKLGEKFYKKKAVVKEVQDLYRAVIKTIDSGDKIRVDQNHLETVIPAQGKLVKIVNGAYRGYDAVLESIEEKKFCCTVSIHSGPLRGRVIDNVQYEDISKIYQPT